MKRNLHSHTQFCDGHSSMEEILIAAQAAGFDTWGFSPHAPICLESPCNMNWGDVDLYFKEVDRLRASFPHIMILAGMEVDYIDGNNSPASLKMKNLGLDYVIGSIHFIPNQKGEFHDIDGSPERFKRYLNDFFEGDLNFVVKTFWLQTQKMIKAGGFDIIGHIDKIVLNASFINSEVENDPIYQKLASETIDLAIKSGKSIEINTKHYAKYGRFFPNPIFWPKILEAGIDMPINSDTHYAHLVDSGRKEAWKIMEEITGKNEERICQKNIDTSSSKF